MTLFPNYNRQKNYRQLQMKINFKNIQQIKKIVKRSEFISINNRQNICVFFIKITEKKEKIKNVLKNNDNYGKIRFNKFRLIN